ncbi:MAG TPA: flagellar biosynthesis protein FlhF [Steroidobacteraceae bacterium]|jgi:flagellar biosynthesis protein FlhF|nr:flagellar biosynthesis protein FlhF [Steroidobacteraceae bacterium]
MKIKKYLSTDMRSALRAVREEQGPDAVILSTRADAQGVEVCAAVDLELAAAPGTLAETAALKQLGREMLEQIERGAGEQAGAAHAPLATAAQSLDYGVESAQASAGEWPLDAALALDAVLGVPGSAGHATSVGEELRSLRALLEQELAALSWNEFTRREPLKARVLSDLARLGLDRALAVKLIEELPAGLSAEQVQRMPYALLARRLVTCASPTERSGAIALIGPPGSGKTTTLAKLATRYVLEQDAANLVIISTDDERLGSHEQLACLGRLLGVRVETVVGTEELAKRITALPNRCILIDTPGVSARDAAAAQRYRELRERCDSLTQMLVLPASAQGGVIEDAVAHFGPPLADCCVLTRIDEAVSLGGVLSVLALSRLPVALASEGPRIPEDLRPARAHQLVARAVELSRTAQGALDDDLLARRYGRTVHAAS